MFWVYIIENAEGRFYVGHTDDIERRMRQHNEPMLGLGKYTHKNGPWILAWFEEHPRRSAAMQRERVIKNWKSAARIRRELLNR